MFSTMKIRSVFLAILLTLVAVAVAGPTAAQAKVPGIKSTPEYKTLKRYVGELQTKRNTTAPPARKASYRSQLASKRTAANTKVKLLYNRRILIISKRDDKKQRRAIKQIRQGQKSDVLSLKARLVDRVNVLQDKAATAVARAKAPYAAKIQKFANKRSILAKRLKKTTNPAKRIKIQDKISSIQRKINVLAAQAQDAANAVSNKYNARIVTVNSLYSAKIANVKARASADIKQAKAAYKRLYRDAISATKELRSNEFELVTSLRDRGAGYIDQMPLPPAAM